MSVLIVLGVLAPLFGAVAAPAGASTRPAAKHAAVRRITLSAAQRQHLRTLYAALRHIPLADLAGKVGPDQAEGAVLRGGAEWAAVSFLPAKGAPAAVADLFQDGAGTAVFTRPAGAGWKAVGLAGEPFACGLPIAQPVRQLWHITRCPAAPAAPPSSRVPPALASGTQQLSDIAVDQVGVSDNPAETSFAGLDCNPYTAMVNRSASTAGCGTDPTFSVKDASELWCADFTKWVWQQAGVTSNLSVLTAGATSFYSWGKDQGESLTVDPTNPQVGDAVVFYPHGVTPSGSTSADHVGVITAVG